MIEASVANLINSISQNMVVVIVALGGLGGAYIGGIMTLRGHKERMTREDRVEREKKLLKGIESVNVFISRLTTEKIDVSKPGGQKRAITSLKPLEKYISETSVLINPLIYIYGSKKFRDLHDEFATTVNHSLDNAMDQVKKNGVFEIDKNELLIIRSKMYDEIRRIVRESDD